MAAPAGASPERAMPPSAAAASINVKIKARIIVPKPVLSEAVQCYPNLDQAAYDVCQTTAEL